jgi:hydroxyacylglutathione hydrolase
MEILIEMIKNRPIDSNCFVIYSRFLSNCIVVDPGTESCEDLLFFLKNNNLTPNYLILTHEHFDHIWGVNKLIETFNSTLVCSEKCFKFIADKKKNLSVFYNQIGFEIISEKNLIVTNEFVNLAGYGFEFRESTGHSLGSISFWIDKNLFTGDLIIDDIKTVTKLPGGSRKQLINTLTEFDKLFKGKKMTVFPGHGEIFFYDDIDFSKII